MELTPPREGCSLFYLEQPMNSKHKQAIGRIVTIANFNTEPVNILEQEEQVIKQALIILTSRLKEKSTTLNGTEAVRMFLRLQLEQKESENFSAMFLDNQNRLIEYQVIFMGTIDSAHVYPREIIKIALKLNARSVIVAHNHPSGVANPSQNDIKLTKRLVSALDLVDIKLLDHMVIGHNEIVSMKEEDLI